MNLCGRPKRVGGLSADDFATILTFLTRYTVEEVADKLGVSISTVRDYRMGKYSIPARVEVKLRKLVEEKTLPSNLLTKLQNA